MAALDHPWDIIVVPVTDGPLEHHEDVWLPLFEPVAGPTQ